MNLLYTTCLDFFCFDLLDQGYEVIVSRFDGRQIVMSELLTNPEKYEKPTILGVKEIRKAHNIRRLLVGRHFDRFYDGE